MQNYLHLVMQTNLNITACHRSTSKLLGTLSLIFYEIASKGFCPPAEFEKELEEGEDQDDLQMITMDVAQEQKEL